MARQLKASFISVALIGLAVALLPAQSTSPGLTAEQVREDVDQFETALIERWSYFKANQPDYKSPLDAIRRRGSSGMTTYELAIGLMRVLALFKDSHAYVTGFQYPAGHLPGRLGIAGGRYVVLKRDRSGFLLDGFPYLAALHGRPVAEWKSFVGTIVPRGSHEYVEYLTLLDLQRTGFLRSIAGLEPRIEIEVRLQSVDGTRQTTITLPSVDAPVPVEPWPAKPSGLIRNNIAYLRIPSMNAAAVGTIREWMPKFRETRGLVVDVRDNGGGSRAAL